MKRYQSFVAVLFFLALSIFSGVEAKQDLAEVDILKRAYQELNALTPLINESRRRADRQGRFRFEYNDLLRDLHLVKHGLRSAIYGVQQRGTSIKGLSGDYGEVGLVGEAEMIQKLLNELQAFSPLLIDAKHQHDPMIQRQVNYEALQGDIEIIISGLQQALAGPGEHPRRIPALRGDFSHD